MPQRWGANSWFSYSETIHVAAVGVSSSRATAFGAVDFVSSVGVSSSRTNLDFSAHSKAAAAVDFVSSVSDQRWVSSLELCCVWVREMRERSETKKKKKKKKNNDTAHTGGPFWTLLSQAKTGYRVGLHSIFSQFNMLMRDVTLYTSNNFFSIFKYFKKI